MEKFKRTEMIVHIWMGYSSISKTIELQGDLGSDTDKTDEHHDDSGLVTKLRVLNHIYLFNNAGSQLSIQH
jgi:hypothetical protein